MYDGRGGERGAAAAAAALFVFNWTVSLSVNYTFNRNGLLEMTDL